MRLPIPLIKQHPESNDCLRCCGLMVLRYFGVDISQKKLWRMLHSYKKRSGLFGGYMQDLGKIAQEMGFKATIYHYEWSWWNKEVALAVNKGARALILALEQLKKNKGKISERKLIQKEIDFIRAGGRFVFDIPRLKVIDKFLKRQIPLIVLIRAEFFYHDPKENYNHAIVVVGKEGNDYLVNDPYSRLAKISAEELYIAWVNTGGWMLVISPKKLS